MLVEVKTLKQLFQRYRRPGDLFFATVFIVSSLVLLLQIPTQTAWQNGTKWYAQPALWPMISILGMAIFATLNWTSSVLSPKMEGRWQEVTTWLRAFEFVGWFMLYVLMVPILGYLPSTIIFAVLLTYRAGYRSKKMLISAVVISICIVVLFKSFLQVKVPGGQIYEMLPVSIRSFMLTYF